MPHLSKSAQMDIPAHVLLELAKDPGNFERMLAALNKRTRVAQGAEAGAKEAVAIATKEAQAVTENMLAEATTEAEAINREATEKAEGRVGVLNERDRDISNRERAVVAREAAQDKRETEYERETAGLRAALKL